MAARAPGVSGSGGIGGRCCCGGGRESGRAGFERETAEEGLVLGDLLLPFALVLAYFGAEGHFLFLFFCGR